MGREQDLARLREVLAKAASGERQIVFVTGEPGIGKTALIEAFVTGNRQQAMGNGDQARQKAKSKKQKPVLGAAEGAKIEGSALSTFFSTQSSALRTFS